MGPARSHIPAVPSLGFEPATSSLALYPSSFSAADFGADLYCLPAASRAVLEMSSIWVWSLLATVSVCHAAQRWIYLNVFQFQTIDLWLTAASCSPVEGYFGEQANCSHIPPLPGFLSWTASNQSEGLEHFFKQDQNCWTVVSIRERLYELLYTVTK